MFNIITYIPDLITTHTPYMPFWMNIVFALLVGGFGRRIAGGLQICNHPNIGDIPIRAFWGFTIGLSMFLAGASVYVILAAILATIIGCSVGYGFPGEKNSTETTLNLGHVGSPNGLFSFTQYKSNVIRLIYHGVGNMFPLTLLYPWFLSHSWLHGWFLEAGLLCWPAYQLGYLIRPNIPCLGMYPADPPPAGEFIWGGIVAAFAVLSFTG